MADMSSFLFSSELLTTYLEILCKETKLCHCSSVTKHLNPETLFHQILFLPNRHWPKPHFSLLISLINGRFNEMLGLHTPANWKNLLKHHGKNAECFLKQNTILNHKNRNHLVPGIRWHNCNKPKVVKYIGRDFFFKELTKLAEMKQSKLNKNLEQSNLFFFIKWWSVFC